MKKSDDFDFEASYKRLRTRHELPDLELMYRDFDVGRISDREPTLLAREIRRVMNEKMTGYLQLFEALINPNGPPMFIFKILNKMSDGEKKKVRGFYDVLSMTQLKVMKLDSVYSEKSEVNFINETFRLWQKINQDIYALFESFENKFESSNVPEERSYFS